MLTPIIKENGVTDTERYLSKLADKTFLSLWSYPNVYTNEGMAKNKIGKEFCDLLVVFENKVIIFSDKDIKFNENKDINVAWGRWYRKSVLESANQLFGAEAWIRQHPNNLFIDKKCTIKLPIELSHNSIEIHLVAVTKNTLSPAIKYFDSLAKGSSGSFIQKYDNDGCNIPPLFTIGDIDNNKTFVHVLDEMSLNLLMNELDTIHDFTSYLSDKVNLIRNRILFLVSGEESLLAFHLTNKMHKIPNSSYVSEQKIILPETFWDEFKNDIDYQIHKSYKLGSKLIDFWLKLFSHHILSATVGHGMDQPLSTHEKALRYLASENRVSRCLIGTAFEKKLSDVPSKARSARLVISPLYQDRLYIFLILPIHEELSKEKYRESRRNIMEAYVLVAKYKYEKIKTITIIATEPKNSELRSEDIISFTFDHELTSDERTQAQQLMKNEKILSDMQLIDKGENFISKVGRNALCPCGSGKKYKKCCLLNI